MAQGKIIVETAQLDAASAKVGELAGTYKGEYEKLYKLVEELQASWAGADNTAYTTQIEGFRDDFEKMLSMRLSYIRSVRRHISKCWRYIRNMVLE